MIRTASSSQTASPFPDIGSLTIVPEAPIPGVLPHPNILRPKPRKPAPPSPTQFLLPSPNNRQRKANVQRQRRRAHSRVSDSGWLTDEIIGGQVEEFDFEENLGKFDKRRDWEEFRVPNHVPQTELTAENG